MSELQERLLIVHVKAVRKYRFENSAFFSSNLRQRSYSIVDLDLLSSYGFGAEDYQLLMDGLLHMFEHDRSATRGEMSVRGLGVFEHENGTRERTGAPVVRSHQSGRARSAPIVCGLSGDHIGVISKSSELPLAGRAERKCG